MNDQKRYGKWLTTFLTAVITNGVVTVPLFGQSPLFAHTQPPNAIRTSGATLNGMVLPGSDPATAWFEWGTSAQYGNVAGLTNVASASGVIALRHTLSGLSPDYVYHCRLVASNVAGVAYGADQQFALGGNVMVWGNPNFGHMDVPADLTNAVAISGGADHCTALRNDGTISMWGGNFYGQRDVPPDLTEAIAVSLGEYHSLSLLPDGTVRAWGAGTTFNPNPDSSNMEGGQSIVPSGLSNVVQIAAGVDHSLALKADGTVAAWGSARLYINSWDPLGQSMVPAGLSNVVAVAGGSFHSMALKIDGTVIVWGYDPHGQGVAPPSLSNVVSVAAGWYHNFALKRDGTLVAWGLGTQNNGFPDFGQAIVPTGLTDIAGMAGGGFYSLAFRRYGTAIGWGRDDYGQVSGASALSNAVAIAGGYDFGLALQSQFPLPDRPPLITRQPTNLLLSASASATFSVLADGTAPLAYQWRFNQNAIASATNSNLVVADVQSEQVGNYAVVVTNSYGAVTSSVASLHLGWFRTFNSPANNSDVAQAVALDASGNVIVTGYSTDGTESDYYTAKYAAADGALLWEKYYTNGIAAAVAVDTAGNVVVTGSSGSFDSNLGLADYLTVKYAAADGALLWERRYNSPADWNDYALAVAVDGSNNVVVTGGTSGTTSGMQFPSVTIKYLANGTGVWTNTGSAQGNVVQAMALDRNGNVVVTGSSWNGTNVDCYTAKYAADSGALLWEKRYNGPGDSADGFNVVAVDVSNNVVVAGNTGVWPNHDYYTTKYAPTDGALLWEKRYNGPGNYDDTARALAIDGSGNVIVTGVSYGDTGDYYTANYAAANGALQWEQRYNSPADSYDDPGAVAVDGSANVVVAGYSFNRSGGSDYYLTKYAATDGTPLWEYRYSDGGNNSLDLALDAQGNVIFAGSTSNGDFLTLKILTGLPEIPIYRFTSIVFTNGGVQLEWTPAPGYVLRQTPSLTAPNWQSVTDSFNTNRITLPATNPSAFFQLVKP